MTSAPRYRQIADDLRRQLAGGEFPVGAKLSPITELQQEYGCQNNLNMIRRAEAVLLDEGLIEPRQGQGTFVIALPSRPDDQAALAEAGEELRAALATTQLALSRFLARLPRTGATAQGLFLTALAGVTLSLALSQLLVQIAAAAAPTLSTATASRVDGDLNPG